MATSAKRNTPPPRRSPADTQQASAASAPPDPAADNDASDESPAASGTSGEARPAAPAIDSALDAWSSGTAREQLAWEIGACRALVRGARALRQAQMEAADRAESIQLRAADQLLSARGVTDFASIQFELLNAHAQETMNYWSSLVEVGIRNATETMQEGAAGWVRLSTATWDGLAQWSRWQASIPQTADLVEAEVEHVAHPFIASPMVWPAQEAARQAFDQPGPAQRAAGAQVPDGALAPERPPRVSCARRTEPHAPRVAHTPQL